MRLTKKSVAEDLVKFIEQLDQCRNIKDTTDRTNQFESIKENFKALPSNIIITGAHSSSIFWEHGYKKSVRDRHRSVNYSLKDYSIEELVVIAMRSYYTYQHIKDAFVDTSLLERGEGNPNNFPDIHKIQISKDAWDVFLEDMLKYCSTEENKVAIIDEIKSADLFKIDYSKELWLLALNGDMFLDEAQSCIDHGADVNYSMRDSELGGVLHVAARLRDAEQMVQLLLENGADVDLVNKAGDTPLMLAVERGHDAVVEKLLAAGADAAPSSAGGGGAAAAPRSPGSGAAAGAGERIKDNRQLVLPAQDQQHKKDQPKKDQPGYRHRTGGRGLKKDGTLKKDVKIAHSGGGGGAGAAPSAPVGGAAAAPPPPPPHTAGGGGGAGAAAPSAGGGGGAGAGPPAGAGGGGERPAGYEDWERDEGRGAGPGGR
jgi:hypothetical protein